MKQFSLILCVVFHFAFAKHELYDGHGLYQVNVEFVEQTQLLEEIQTRYNLDVWVYAYPGRPGQILVPGHLKEQFQEELAAAGITYSLEVENIKEKLDLEDSLLEVAAARSNRSRSLPGLSFDVIHRYAVVDRYLVDLANTYPNVRVFSAGRSVEGRDIKYITISTTNFQDTRKPVVMLQSLLHAREWVTLPATLYAIEKLVIDVTERDLVNDIDWIILPIANPDGYEHSHTSARFWRKNRARNSFCMGVDLNRNFDIFWGTASSTNPCSDTFHGRRAFSEPESAIVRDILHAHRNRLELYIDIHSFGSMVLYGYGNRQLPPNALAVNYLGVQMAQAIDAVKWPQNRNYIVGNVAMVLYMASGGSSDYAMVTGVPFSYTFELPSYRGITSTVQGFLVEPDFILQAGFETWEAIKVGARFAARNFNRRAGQ
ncbi:carboxypeptidase B [Bombyx mori]|uniref:Peptidase M14 domain-containing protein n=1 Tax=Bombyx mori TaxID=7091 RepID=A0A8R2AFT9_BOMMO|nr:zinc carboxypeptidase [Bombyx mori]